MKKKVLGMKKIVLRMKKIVPFIYYLFNATEQESIATKPDVKFFIGNWKKNSTRKWTIFTLGEYLVLTFKIKQPR